jgi:hypothetical protein
VSNLQIKSPHTPFAGLLLYVSENTLIPIILRIDVLFLSNKKIEHHSKEGKANFSRVMEMPENAGIIEMLVCTESPI